MVAQRPPSLPPPGPPPGDEDFPEPPRIRALRRLVTLLTMSAIIGVLVVAATLVIRLGQPLTVSVAPPLDLRAVAADSIAAPAGEAIIAAGAAQGALILVTRDAEGAERLHLYDAASGALIRTVRIAREP